jgi:hypothetical protein
VRVPSLDEGLQFLKTDFAIIVFIHFFEDAVEILLKEVHILFLQAPEQLMLVESAVPISVPVVENFA